MRYLLVLASALSAIVVSSPGFAFESIGRSHPLRTVLLDALRPSIQAEVETKVQFVVDKLQVDGDWAFMAGTVQRPDGSPIDFTQTRYAEWIEEGAFDGPTVRALLRNSGNDWVVETFSIGATDVVEAGWPLEYDVPCTLVEYC